MKPPSRDAASYLAELNTDQREAATAPEGPVLIVAGAGTGKTKTLAARVAWLVARGVDPERIMLLTFTRRAAEEMTRRAEGALSAVEGATPGIDRIWAGTFHAVANRLLRTYGQAIGLDPEFTVLDRADAEDLMDLVRHEIGIVTGKTRFPRKQTCVAIYSRCVNSSDSIEDTLKGHYPWCLDWDQELRTLFKAYTEAKQRQSVLDYDDLLLYWFHLLGDEALADSIEDRFSHILVDEYQDTNRLQAGILQRMRRKNRNLGVVGDDAQSIYGFRAAEVRNILDFPKQFAGTRIVRLERNYRSTQPILEATNGIIGLAKERHAKELWSERKQGARPVLVTCEREEEQTDYVVTRLLENLETGIDLRRQAVLVRTGHWSDSLEVELTRRKIPFRKFGGLKFLEAAHVKDLMSFLRIVENPRDQLAYLRVLRLLEGIGPTTARNTFTAVQEAGGDPAALETVKATREASGNLMGLSSLLKDLRVKKAKQGAGADIQRVRGFYDPMLERLYENPDPRRNDLDQLERIASGYKSRQSFLTDLTLDPPRSTQDFAGPPSKDEDWLTVSTIHSAKGCEWDVVFLIHASDGVLPSDLSTGDSAQIEEERRLLYVACTRAKNQLHVLHPLRYYVKGRGNDAHGYAQLTRFIPREVKRFFDARNRGRSGESTVREARIQVADIRKAIQGMWE